MKLLCLALACALAWPASGDEKRAAKIAGGTLLGVGLVSLAAGAALTQLATAYYNELNDPPPGYVFNPETERRLQLYQPLGIALLSIGVASTAASVTVLLLGRRRP
jgi:hypothetical protein